MRLRFWHEVWKEGKPNFHRKRAHPMLVKYFHHAPTKVMVPLCGKTVDLLWLRKQGHEVVGIEVSPIACKEFFTDNGIAYKKKRIGMHSLYAGGGITIWCGDFFKIPRAAWEGVGAVYDRAALIALPEPARRRYVKTLTRNFAEGRNILLITNTYPKRHEKGAPHTVPEKEVRALYGKSFSVKKLVTKRDTHLTNKKKFVGVEVLETGYELERKPKR